MRGSKRPDRYRLTGSGKCEAYGVIGTEKGNGSESADENEKGIPAEKPHGSILTEREQDPSRDG